MKKCPHCKAEIEENAHFCLYCMTSLDEKQVVLPPIKRKPFLLIGGAVLLAVLILILSCCVGGGQTPPQKEQGSMTPDESVMQQPEKDASSDAPEQTAEPTAAQTEPEPQPPVQTEQTDPVIPQNPTQTQQDDPVTPQPTTQLQKPEDPIQPKPTEPVTSEPFTQTEPEAPVTSSAVCTHQYQVTQTKSATCTADGSNTYTCSLCGDSYRETVAAPGHSNQAATCVLPQICKVCGTTGSAALGHGYQNGICIRCGETDPGDPRNVYEYRAAQAGDQLTDGTWDPETDIVITGVKKIAADGVYEIPACIDGKRVVSVRPLAFSDTDARKVTLGKNMIYVAQNAFSGCYNIEALYVRSNRLFLSRSAFIPASSRSCTLKIYCAAQCTVKDDLKGECYLKDIVRVYGGEFHEWNG